MIHCTSYFDSKTERNGRVFRHRWLPTTTAVGSSSSLCQLSTGLADEPTRLPTFPDVDSTAQAARQTVT